MNMHSPIETGKIYRVLSTGLVYFEIRISESYSHGRFLDEKELFYVESEPEYDEYGTCYCKALLENGFMVSLEIIGHSDNTGAMIYDGFEPYEGEMKKFELKPVEEKKTVFDENDCYGLWD